MLLQVMCASCTRDILEELECGVQLDWLHAGKGRWYFSHYNSH